jgi:hypothetical protein
MGKTRTELRLPPKAAHERPREVLGDHLDRHLAPQPLVLGAVDGGHPTRARAREQSIPAADFVIQPQH